MQPTTAIAPVIRLAVVDAIDDARTALREVAKSAAKPSVEQQALLAAEYLTHVEALVRDDEHDPLMHLRIGEAGIALEDAAADLPQRPRLLEVVVRLRTAGLLLQSARRAADLERRLGDILPDAQGIADMAGEAPADRAGDIIINANRIARLARA